MSSIGNVTFVSNKRCGRLLRRAARQSQIIYCYVRMRLAISGSLARHLESVGCWKRPGWFRVPAAQNGISCVDGLVRPHQPRDSAKKHPNLFNRSAKHVTNLAHLLPVCDGVANSSMQAQQAETCGSRGI